MIRQRIVELGWVWIGKCGMCPGSPDKFANKTKSEYMIKVRSGSVQWFKITKAGRPFAQGATVEQLEAALQLI